MSARKQMMNELTIVIEANPLLRGRTKFPQINKSRLRRLINQRYFFSFSMFNMLFENQRLFLSAEAISYLLFWLILYVKFVYPTHLWSWSNRFYFTTYSLNWQHLHCTHPHPQPHIDTLFTDHKCPGPDHLHLQDQLNEGNPSVRF